MADPCWRRSPQTHGYGVTRKIGEEAIGMEIYKAKSTGSPTRTLLKQDAEKPRGSLALLSASSASLCHPMPECTLGAPNLEEESHAYAEAQDHA